MPDLLELAARFVASLYAATRGRPGRFQRVSDCAERAGIVGPDIERAIDTAEAAGLLVRHVDEPTVMLTAKGLKAGRPSSQ
jgi:DNA-binding MarR family transcriptional regulator